MTACRIRGPGYAEAIIFRFFDATRSTRSQVYALLAATVMLSMAIFNYMLCRVQPVTVRVDSHRV
jgi:hypothetical protein